LENEEKTNETPRVNLAAKHRKLPPVWDRGAQDAGARAFASDLGKQIERGEVIPANLSDWMGIYVKQTKTKRWMKLNLEMSEDKQETEIGNAPQGGLATAKPVGEFLAFSVVESLAKRDAKALDYFERAVEAIKEVTISHQLKQDDLIRYFVKELASAHSGSNGALSANLQSMSKLNVQLLGGLTDAHAEANNLANDRASEISRIIKAIKEEKEIPEIQRDTFDKVIDTVKAIAPVGATGLMALLSVLGVQLPPELQKAIVSMVDSSGKKEEKEQEEENEE
jgi:hypothetical protein